MIRAVIAALAIVSASSVEGQERQDRPDEPQQQTSAGQADGEVHRSLFQLPPIWFREWKDPDEAADDEIQEEAARQREKDDLVAQIGMNTATQSIRRATWWMLLTSSLSVIVGAAGTFAIVRSTKLTRRATEAAEAAVEVTRKIGMDQTRAYLTVDSANLVRDGHDNRSEALGMGWKVILSIANSGQTPAIWYSIRGVAYSLKREKSAEFVRAGQRIAAANAKETVWPAITNQRPLETTLFDPDVAVAAARAQTVDDVFMVSGQLRYRTIFQDDGVITVPFEFYTDGARVIAVASATSGIDVKPIKLIRTNIKGQN